MRPYCLLKPIRNSAIVETIAEMYSSKICPASLRVTAIKITAVQIKTMVANTDTYFIYDHYTKELQPTKW